MKAKHLLIFLVCCINNILTAQITFQKTIGGSNNELGYCMQGTSDGGYIITGATGFGGAGVNVYLARCDSFGNLLWTKTFGGVSSTERGHSVQQTADGGYIIAGYTKSFGAGDRDVYLIKSDTNGDSLWTKTFGGLDEDGGYAVQQTTDGGFIVSGYTLSFSSGNRRVYLIRTDADGDSLWTKTFGSYFSEGHSILQTADSGFIIAGRTLGTGLGLDDIYLIKTDANGDSLWTKNLGGSFWDFAESIQQTTDGGYIITGRTGSFGAGEMDIYLIKTDSIGNLIWSKTFGGADDDFGQSVIQTNDGGYILAGYTANFGASGLEPDIYAIKTDANGDTLWTKIYDGIGSGQSFSVMQADDGGYIIAGLTSNLGFSICLIKTDSNGISGCNERNPATITSTPATLETIVAAAVTSTATIVTSPATLIGTGGSVTTLCISYPPCSSSFSLYPDTTQAHHYYAISSTTGIPPLSYDWSWGDGVHDYTVYPSHVYADSGYYTICLTITDSVGCSSIYCDSSVYLTRSDGYNTMVYINVVSQIPTDVEQIIGEENGISIYPNPAGNQFTIRISNSVINAIEVYNTLGGIVYNATDLNCPLKNVDCELFSRGIYYVKVQSEKGSVGSKLLIE